MKPSLRTPFAVFAASAALLTLASAADTKTLHYPTQDESMFSIEAPSDWKVEEIREVGEYGTLESENGSVLQFRAVECENEEEAVKEIDSIVDATPGFLKDNYTDIELGDPTEITIDGRQGSELSGTGKDKDGNTVHFLSAMIALGPKSIAEIWAAIFTDDTGDLEAAKTILKSFKPTGAPAKAE